MNVLKTAILAAILLCRLTSPAQTAAEILEKHEQAMGGLSNWNKIKTMEFTASVLQQGMEIPYTLKVKAGKAMYVTNTYNEYTNTWVIVPHPDGKEQTGRTSKKVNGETIDNVTFYWPEVNMVSSLLLDYKTNGMNAVYEGKDTAGNTPCYKLKLTRKNGTSLTAYFDMNTYYLLRLETVLLVDDLETEIFVGYKNYQKMNDVVIPMSCTNPNTGVAAVKETVFKKITINPPLDDSLFKPEPK